MLEVLLVALVVFPTIWIYGEFTYSREARLFLGVATILASSAISYVLGALREFDANMHFGAATKDLIANTITALENDGSENVLKCLQELKSEYKPTYSSRDQFEVLARDYARKVSPKPVFHEPGGYLWEDPNDPSEESEFIAKSIEPN